MRRSPRGPRRSVDRGTHRPAIEPPRLGLFLRRRNVSPPASGPRTKYRVAPRSLYGPRSVVQRDQRVLGSWVAADIAWPVRGLLGPLAIITLAQRFAGRRSDDDLDALGHLVSRPAVRDADRHHAGRAHTGGVPNTPACHGASGAAWSRLSSMFRCAPATRELVARRVRRAVKYEQVG